MELEGFRRMAKYMKKAKLSMRKLVTDRHRQIAKYVREYHPTVCHMYDVWHVAKGMYVYSSVLQSYKIFCISCQFL